MEIGSTSGRGFESAFAPYIWGAMVVVALLLWIWFHYDIRKRELEEQGEKGQDE